MITNGSQVSLEYKLTLDDGTLVESNVGKDPLLYTHGNGQILPALERELTNMEVNDTKKVSLSAEEGYGPVNPNARQSVSLEAIPVEGRHEGAVLQAKDSEGRVRSVRVDEIRDDQVVLDLNHQLAGKRLNFEIRVLKIA